MHIFQKTALTLAILAITSTSTNAQIRRTSADLSKESVLPTVIVSAPLIAVGTVIAFPSNTPPSDAQNWLECNGQSVPAGTKYDLLRARVGSNVPDLRDKFLRSTADVEKVGTTVTDSIKSHTVDVPGQSATVSASLDSTNVEGTASPQQFSYQGTGEASAAIITSAPNSTVGMSDLNNTHDVRVSMTVGGAISGNVSNGHVTGIADVKPVIGVYSGAAETAPLHYNSRYFIRAVQ